MNCKNFLVAAAGMFVLVSVQATFAVKPEVARKMSEANAAYAAGQYEEALEAYKLTEVDCPECPELAYNEALAYYRLRDFGEARQRFNDALATREPVLEANAKFNLGNVAYAEALEKMSSLEEAIKGAEESIRFYRSALDMAESGLAGELQGVRRSWWDRLTGGNADGDWSALRDDARANIETAQLLIKDLLDKQKQEQEQNPDQQQEQDQQQQDQQQQGEQEQENDEQQQDQQNQDEKSEDQEKQDQQQEQGQQEQDKQKQGQQDEGDESDKQEQPPQEADGEPREVEMSPEEVERMLQAVRDREAQRRDEKTRRARVRRVPVTRDW